MPLFSGALVACLIAAILLVSLLSWPYRAFELRVSTIDADEAAASFLRECGRRQIRLLANEPDRARSPRCCCGSGTPPTGARTSTSSGPRATRSPTSPATYLRRGRGASGVRVNGVSPGPVRTACTEQMLGENVEALGQANIRGQVGEPDEIAEVVLFLVDDRSSSINGTVVLANGGERSSLPG